MLSFIEFLTEKAFVFAKGRDQDYTSDVNTILFFNKNEAASYVIAGKTHGIQSHAIKHLEEFNPSFVKEKIDETRTIIKSYITSKKLSFCGIYERHNGFKETDPLKSITQATDDTLKNTLDMINDKFIAKATLLPIESEIYNSVIKPIEDEYGKEILSRIKGSENLDKYNTVNAVIDKITHVNNINFMGVAANGKGKRFYLDFATNSIVIKYDGYIHTLFKFNLPGQGYQQVLSNFRTKFKSVKIISKYVENAFKQLGV